MVKYVFYDRLEAVVLARQYKHKSQFQKENAALYKYAVRHGWWDEMSKFMVAPNYKKKWDKPSIIDVSKTIFVKKDFQKNFPGAYAAARKMGILDSVCAHMKRRLSPKERELGRACSKCWKYVESARLASNSAICLDCHNIRNKEYAKNNPGWKASTVALRRAKVKQAIPAWIGKSEKRKMLQFYKLARKLSEETGIPHEVDHIHPIQSDILCGLHVPENLRVVTRGENRAKSNKVVLNV